MVLPVQSDLQMSSIPFLFQEIHSADVAFMVLEQSISNPSRPLQEMHVTVRISPPWPAPLPVLLPKISMLYSDDTNFSYPFLLAGSRQFFLQGFADILQISP